MRLSGNSRIFLVGPMGAGKTTIGRRLAKGLGRAFIDADQALEERTGATIALIFDIEGESGFREREKRIIDELTQMDDVVIATGGGAVLDADNRSALRERGLVVYLHASIAKLLERTRRDVNRPLLNTEDPEQRMKDLMETRRSLYEEVADLSIDTGRKSLAEVVRLIKSECQ